MSDVIGEIQQFNELNGMDTTKFNIRAVALYKGLQIEELLEGLEAIFKNHKFDSSSGLSVPTFEDETIARMKSIMTSFKQGHYDNLVQNVCRKELLDSDIDTLYVSVGAALASGANVRGAFAEIQRSNMSKVNPETGKMDKDANGKVIKPPTYSPPDLTPFVRD